eukprot:TRINITY_DN466_c0_g2_i3.p1 TRINITY_DN466_c0_g2~~TRINITY_DN466_c0_g2_i3.p1  ORF type:complete len:230 (+),score=50.84 TRINITY_DN466_c0_g2_i3:884-1573(+)
MAAIEEELRQIGSGREVFDQLMREWFEPPISWGKTFDEMTEFAVLDGALENVQDSTFGPDIQIAKMREKPDSEILPKRSVLIKTVSDFAEFRRTLMNLTFLQRAPKCLGQHIVHFFGTLTHDGKQVLVFENCQATLEEHLQRTGKTLRGLAALRQQIDMGQRFIAENFNLKMPASEILDRDVWLKISGENLVAKLRSDSLSRGRMPLIKFHEHKTEPQNRWWEIFGCPA